MIVSFDPNTLIPRHIIHHHPPGYEKHLDSTGETYLVSEESFSPFEVEIVLRDGQPTINRRQPLPIIAPAEMKVGVEASFADVPAGVFITVNGELKGQMDVAGALEFTAGDAGFYRFEFSGQGWIGKEFRLEAIA